MKTSIVTLAAVVVLVAPMLGQLAAQEADRDLIGQRLEAYADRLRLGMTLATVAAFSPLLENVHLHAQQLVNLLEGSRGRHFVRTLSTRSDDSGLIDETDSVGTALRRWAETSPLREPVLIAIENVRTYLHMALDASLSALEQRRQERAVAEMLRAFAYLSAALGREADPAYVPGLLTISRLVTRGR